MDNEVNPEEAPKRRGRKPDPNSKSSLLKKLREKNAALRAVRNASGDAQNPSGANHARVPHRSVANPVSVPVGDMYEGLSPDELDQILECDQGDIVARESWSPKSNKPFARREDFAPSMTYLPDLQFPRTLGNRLNPTEQYNRAWLEEDGSKNTRQTSNLMRQKGWRPATTTDGFLICPELSEAIRADDSGRLVLADVNGKSTAVIMVRSKADYAKDRKQLLRFSDSVQESAEEKAAKLQERIRRAGANGVVASSVMESD